MAYEESYDYGYPFYDAYPSDYQSYESEYPLESYPVIFDDYLSDYNSYDSEYPLESYPVIFDGSPANGNEYLANGDYEYDY